MWCRARIAVIAVLAVSGVGLQPAGASAEEGFVKAVPTETGSVAVPGTDHELIDRLQQEFPARGAEVADSAVTNENSAPVAQPEGAPSWAPHDVLPDELREAIPTATPIGALTQDPSSLLNVSAHSCCFGAPAPIYVGEITAQNRNSFGRCLFTAATDTPRAKYGNFRDITYGMTIDCPHSWLQGTGQARLMYAEPTDSFCCHLGWAPQFSFDGGMGYGYAPYHRRSDTEMQFIAGWFDITVDDTSNSAGFSSAAGSDYGLECEGLLSKRLRCWFYTKPFAFVPDVVDPTQCREGVCATVNGIVDALTSDTLDDILVAGVEDSDPYEDASEQQYSSTSPHTFDANGPVAQAAVTYNPCNPGPAKEWNVCRTYARPESNGGTWYTMRWGSRTFGYRHIRIRHGFGPQTDRRIAHTIRNGSIERESNGTLRFHARFGCRYRVVYQPKNSKGIITAYVIANTGGCHALPQ